MAMTEEQALTEAQRRWGHGASVRIHAVAGFQVSSMRMDNRWGDSHESWEAAFADASQRDIKNGHNPASDWVKPKANPPVRRYTPPAPSMEEIVNPVQYTVVVRSRDIVVYRIDILNPEPCKKHAKFTGRRFPLCMCLPCLNKYLDACRARGQKVVVMPEGWSIL